MEGCRAYPIKEGIEWVGALDPSLRVFDVIMNTKWGTSYNAYLVRGENACALVEAVKDKFAQDYLESLKETIDLKQIKYIVLNHTEPDHTGAMREVLKAIPGAQVVCSRAAAVLIREIVNEPMDIKVVSDGDQIDLGGCTLQFISAPFLHWPDSIFTHIPQWKTLISGDVFGCHYAFYPPALYCDQIDREELTESRKYYFDCIMDPFKKYMLEAIDKLAPLDIEMICPSHGPIIRTDIVDVVSTNRQWSADVLSKNNKPKALIAYVSAYGYTRSLADTIAQQMTSEGIDCDIQEVTQENIASLVIKMQQADAILIGSPTFNRDALAPIWTLLSAVSSYHVRDKFAGAFGSYGWSGEAVRFVEERLRQLGLKTPVAGCRVKLKPSDENIDQAKAFAREFTDNILK